MEEFGNTLVENMNKFFFIQTFKMLNQTWKHTIEPQKPLDEIWKQIGPISRIQMRMERKSYIHSLFLMRLN
jgi:hypothetical protein